jgi:tetratricopeptide (TPR) repeat protein
MPHKEVDTSELLHRAEHLYYQRNFEECEHALKELAEHEPQKGEAFYGLGVLHYQLNMLETAETYLRCSLRESPKHSNALFYLGEIAAARGQLREAGGFYEKALEANPKHRGAANRLERLARHLLASGKRLYQQGRFDESEATFRQVLKFGRFEAAALYGLGVTELGRDHLEKAKLELTRCLKMHPRHANACFYLGVISSRLGDRDGAQSLFRKTLEINPRHAGALKALGLQPKPQPSDDEQPKSQPADANSSTTTPAPVASATTFSTYRDEIFVRVIAAVVAVFILFGIAPLNRPGPGLVEFVAWAVVIFAVSFPVIFIAKKWR